MADASKASGSEKGKMVKVGIVVIVFGVIAWQAMGMFGGGDDAAVAVSATAPVNPNTPKSASLMAGAPPKEARQLTQREQQLMLLQQQTEAKYIAALNELQMLKVEKEIAETKNDINKATLSSISSQKGIVDLLTPPVQPEMPTSGYAQGLESPGGASALGGEQAANPDKDVKYSVVSVSKLRGKWVAVLGVKGKLYSVSVGDVLGVTGDVIMSINASGIMIETKDGEQKKVSMVPII